jgi:hypothetical protein
MGSEVQLVNVSAYDAALSPKLAAKATETVLERHLDLMRAWLDPTLSAVVLQRANCSCELRLASRRYKLSRTICRVGGAQRSPRSLWRRCRRADAEELGTALTRLCPLYACSGRRCRLRIKSWVGDTARSSRRARCPPAFCRADYTTAAPAVRAQAHRLPALSQDRSSIQHIDILRGHADVSEGLAVQPRKLVTLMLNLQIAADASRHQPKPRHDSGKHAKPRLKFAAHDLLLRNRRVTSCAEKTGRRSPALPQSLAILRATGCEELTRSVETPRE